ncbi:MAG TPA: acyltransferase [Candidatus Saccharimonadia bacterium]|nr:acyltransferase [Candidatus Saccharimonadia bacterium]
MFPPEESPGHPRPAAAAVEIAPLTGLRGIAAAWVALMHLWLALGSPAFALTAGPATLDFTALAATGYFGVDLFFVLSGFLIGHRFVAAAISGERAPDLGRFWLRRCRRVLPAYYVQLVILLVASLAWTGSLGTDWATIASHFAMLFLLVPPDAVPLNGVYWTLPVEWFSYAMVPILAWLLRSARVGYVLLALLVWVVTFRMLCLETFLEGRETWHTDYGSIMHLRSRIDQFFFGMLAAYAYIRLPEKRRRGALMLALGLVATLALAFGVHHLVPDWLTAGRAPWLFVHYTATGAALALVVYGAAGDGRFAQRALASAPLLWLGAISYSLYLWHGVVFALPAKLGVETWPHAHRWVAAAALVALALVVSWASYRFVEMRFYAPSTSPWRKKA